MSQIYTEPLGLCEKKQYEHAGPHAEVTECGQSMPPFPCKNWKPITEPSMTPISPIPEQDLEEQAEKLASSMYQPHRFGDQAAWFNACVRLAKQHLERIAKLTAEVERLTQAFADTSAAHKRVALERDALMVDAHNLKSSVHAICNQNLTETLTAALEEKQRADALEAQNTRLKAPVTAEEKFKYSFDDKVRYALWSEVEALIASRATRTPPQEGQ